MQGRAGAVWLVRSASVQMIGLPTWQGHGAGPRLQARVGAQHLGWESEDQCACGHSRNMAASQMAGGPCECSQDLRLP